jgi:arabinogalactan oligomer/maltooligosaccharide transport system substrate-binding protein
MPPAPRGLTLWYGYAENSPEEQALRALVERARPSVAGAEITLLRVPGAELINRFETEAAAGGGPDLLLAANDNLGRDVRAGLLHSLDSAALDTRDAASLESMRVDGKLYGLPLTYSTIALYSNTARVTTPPATTQALLDAVKSGAKAVFIRSAYHNFGLFGAFGGRLLDEGGRCVADQGGFTEALAYMRELKAAGAQFVPSGREAQELFRSGQADLTIDGDWLLADFRASLGDQLGVAPLPAGPAGPARPLVASSGFFVSANSRQAENATALALALTDEQAQQQISSQTQLIPSSPQITPADAAQAALASSARNGVPRPQRPELDAFWQPFDAALGDVLETDVDPAQAVQAACAAMNSANGK